MGLGKDIKNGSMRGPGTQGGREACQVSCSTPEQEAERWGERVLRLLHSRAQSDREAGRPLFLRNGNVFIT